MPRGLHDSAPILWSGGVNLNADIRAIRRDQLALSKNAFPSKSGTLDKRPGVVGDRLDDATIYPFSVGTPPSVSGYTFLCHYLQTDAVSPTHKLLASSLNPAGFNTPTFLSGAAIQDLGAMVVDQDPIQFVNYQGRTIAIVPGIEGFYQLAPKVIPTDGYEWIKASFLHSNSTAGVAANQTQSVLVAPRIAASYRQRMYYANFGAGKGNWIIAADRVSATHTNVRTAPLWSIVGSDVLAYNGRYIALAQIEGEDITNMTEVSLQSTGSQIDTILMVNTKKSTLFITGEFLQTFDSGGTTATTQFGDFKSNKVNYSCGCVGHMAICKTPYGYIWAGPDDVWMLNGNAPFRIGTNIRPALQACPENEQKYWSIAYANGVLILSLVTTVTTASDGTGSLVNLPVTQQWWLDLRQGPPRDANSAKWYGPMEVADGANQGLIGTSALLGQQDTDGSERIVALASLSAPVLSVINYFPGSGSEDVLQQTPTSAPPWAANTDVEVGDMCRPTQDANGLRQGFLYVCSVAGTTDISEPSWDTAGGDTTDGTVTWSQIFNFYSTNFQDRYQYTGYQTDIRGRGELFGDAMNEKKYSELEIDAEVSKGAAIYGYAIPNGGSSKNTLGPGLLRQTQLIGGVSRLDNDTIGDGEAQSRTLRPEENTRVLGRSFQTQISDSDEYVIDDTNDYLILSAFQASNPTVPDPLQVVQVQITHGVYATIQLLMAEIVSKLQSNPPSDNWYTNGVWESVDPFGSQFPYMNNLKLTVDANNAYAVGFIYAASDFAANAIPVGSGGNVLYASRAKRLLSLIGFDTTYRSFQGFDIEVDDIYLDAPVNASAVITRAVAPSAIEYRWYSTQVISKYNNVGLKLISATQFIKHKTARPLEKSTR